MCLDAGDGALASVGPIRIREWSAVAHMLSVMVPVNFRALGASSQRCNHKNAEKKRLHSAQ